MTLPAPGSSDALSVRDFIDRHSLHNPGAVFLIDPISGESLNFLQCAERVRQISGVICENGVQAGSPVAYACSNSTETALIILGILYGGHVATAINLVAGESTISYVLEHSEAKMIFVDESSRDMIEPLIAGFSDPPDFLTFEQAGAFGANQNANTLVSADAEGLLMYTSGTTGLPKGVLLTQASLLAGGFNTAKAHELTSKDRGLCVLPFYHINAFCVSLMGSLVSGGSLVVPPRFSATKFWETIKQTNCTWFSVVPTQISYLLHQTDVVEEYSGLNVERLRFGRSASAPLSPEMHQAFEERFNIPIIETMGLTESAAQILSNPLPPRERKIGSPGIPFGNDVVIADTEQQEVPSGEEGEILVRGPNILKGYLKNSQATADTITSEGWLRTGDLGRMDTDGYVYVTGRLKELIIKGGENIAPREVDEALYTHPDVIEAAAFGVECNDYGQRVEAGVKLDEKSSASAEELVELCKEKIGYFKAPDKVHILDDLPKGPSGKIQRRKLADIING
ncbi:MAG: AMP-binding protein [Pseudomonadota bacterium]